ncbi:hypothetical protein O9993_17760 [Vibrio lentus]|nr:hypothetical protein [Vibrio lentus]
MTHSIGIRNQRTVAMQMRSLDSEMVHGEDRRARRLNKLALEWFIKAALQGNKRCSQ